ncbi:MAG TPA: glutamate--tRNA ligase, partial [Microbacterium sp.]|nr:glutamate--tRNA ligase [Microbacterium sp.]
RADLFLQREKGFVREGLLNYLSLLGWSIAADRDVFTLDEFVAAFNIEDVNPNPARFDQKKAESINGDHIRLLSLDEFADRLVPYLQATGALGETPTDEQLALLKAAAPLVKERMQLLGEAPGMLGFLFTDELEYEEDAVAKLSDDAPRVLEASAEALRGLESFDTESIQNALSAALIDGLELKPRVAYASPRVAISGRRVSPPLFESMELLGKERTVERLEALKARLTS